jgi:hypothetical protein
LLLEELCQRVGRPVAMSSRADPCTFVRHDDFANGNDGFFWGLTSSSYHGCPFLVNGECVSIQNILAGKLNIQTMRIPARAIVLSLAVSRTQG